jgi:ABC-type dipeptide/oligopeptide/nickel transport system permease component
LAFLLNFLIRRLCQGVVIVLIVSFTIFAMLRIVPGDPVRLMLGPMTSDDVIEETARSLGLRDPIPVQYIRYIGSVLRGDLGTSFTRAPSGEAVGGNLDLHRGQRAKVLDLIAASLPFTLQLAALGLVFTALIAVPLGISAGLMVDRWPDRLAVYVSSIFVSTPNFWLGIVLALVFTARLGWIPSIGYGNFAYTILPAIVIAIEVSPLFIRSLSVAVASTMQQPFVELGRLRGLSERRIFLFHVLRNASIPILNLFGVQLGALLGGVMIVEYIFSYPGLGFLTVQSVLQRDFPTIEGIAMLTSSVFVIINIGVDLASATIDRRLEF